jgi:hypothetical protein
VSIFGDVMDVAKHVGSGMAHVVESGAKDLGNVLTGSVVGGLLGGPAGSALGAYVGSQVGTGAVNASAGALGPGDLVKAVLHGPGTSSLYEVHAAGLDEAKGQEEIETDTRKMATDLESAWTGPGADAARARIQPLIDTSASAAATLQQNARLTQEAAAQFDSMKNSLHPDVTNDAPTKDTVDVLTPWATDNEDAINQHNQKAQENLQRFTSYSQQTSATTSQRTIDYGQLGDDKGGSFQVTPPTPPPVKPGGKPGTGGPGSSSKNKDQNVGGSNNGGPGPSYVPPPQVGSGTHSPGTGSNYQAPPSPGNSTIAAGYTPPPLPSGYQQGGFGPGSSSYSPVGSGSMDGSGGFGPVGGGGFGPGGGSFDGSGSGSASGAGSRNLAGGKASGVGAFDESAGRPRTTGSGGGAPATGKPGMNGMGAGGKGKGEGSEDREHARATYLIEPDPDSIFGTDQRTVPPVIGL